MMTGPHSAFPSFYLSIDLSIYLSIYILFNGLIDVFGDSDFALDDGKVHILVQDILSTKDSGHTDNGHAHQSMNKTSLCRSITHLFPSLVHENATVNHAILPGREIQGDFMRCRFFMIVLASAK